MDADITGSDIHVFPDRIRTWKAGGGWNFCDQESGGVEPGVEQIHLHLPVGPIQGFR